jgi:hypothetical protein
VSDRLEQFESELANMRPRAATPQISERVSKSLFADRRSDRMLIGAMSMGAMAACVIVTILIGESTPPSQSSPTVAVTSQVPRIGSDLQAFADASVTDSWK